MKNLSLFMYLIFLSLGILCAQEKYELTNIDIFSMAKPPSGIELSVRGVSLGDSIESVLNKFNKTQHNIIKGKYAYTLDIGDSFRIVFSPDSKTVNGIALHSAFKKYLKGKTAQYFDLSSVARIKAFTEEIYGQPDYIFQQAVGPVVVYRSSYLNGFEFGFEGEETSLEIATKERIVLVAQIFGAEKVEKAENIMQPEAISRPTLSKYGFRTTLWGMSKDQVKGTETSGLQEYKLGGDLSGLDALYFNTEVAGLNCQVVYYFADNMLTRARYIFGEEHSNKNIYIEDFEKIKGKLNESYGIPDKDRTIWSDKLYQDDPSEYGMAVSVGHLQYLAEWRPPETSIRLFLKGDNYKIQLVVEYSGDNFMEFEKKVINKSQKGIW